MFVQVLEVLQRQVTELGKLPVATVLRKALKYEKNGSLNDLGTLQTSRFITNWQFEVPLTTEGSDSASSDQLTSLACDGKFLYVVSGTTKGLTKIGTGKHGTLRYVSQPSQGLIVHKMDLSTVRSQYQCEITL